MLKFTKSLSGVAIAVILATATPTHAQVIINNSRLPVYADRSNYCIGSYCYYNPNGLTNNEISGAIILLLLLSAWINRRNLAWWWKVEIEKIQSSSAKKPAKKNPPRNGRSQKIQPLPDPIEDLSGGLAQIPTKPEPEKIREIWYVYRAGKPQGPYEKFQLRSFEKITAESKVRRAGEKGWVRAGEVSELADFIS